jgi:hypothetical protein
LQRRSQKVGSLKLCEAYYYFLWLLFLLQRRFQKQVCGNTKKED